MKKSAPLSIALTALLSVAALTTVSIPAANAEVQPGSAFAAPVAYAAPNPYGNEAEQIEYLFQAINDYRVANGAKPLVRNASIDVVAQNWTNYSVSTARFAHNENFFSQIPQANLRSGGEIIAHNQDAESILISWQRSEGHNANLLNPNFTDFGIGLAKQDQLPGAEGYGNFWSTVVFAQYDAVVVEPTEPPVEPTEPPVDPTDPPVDPTDPPVEPTEPPVDPTDPPVEPTDPPVEPTEPPVDPTDPPVDPTDPPVEPTDPPVEPTEPPVDPTDPPVEPTDPPVEPTEPPVDPTDPPVEPTEPPVEPTEPPVDPTDPPVEPTDPPVDPTDPPVDPTDPPVDPTDPPVDPTEPPTVDPTRDSGVGPITGQNPDGTPSTSPDANTDTNPSVSPVAVVGDGAGAGNGGDGAGNGGDGAGNGNNGNNVADRVLTAEALAQQELDKKELAETGSTALPLALVALTLLGAGGAFVLSSRRNEFKH